MSDEFTPDAESVRAAYMVAGTVPLWQYRDRWSEADEAHGVEFDRWLASERAKAFGEGQRSVTIAFAPSTGAPIRVFNDNPYMEGA